jgi:polysaccharide export outer membrane protein
MQQMPGQETRIMPSRTMISRAMRRFPSCRITDAADSALRIAMLVAAAAMLNAAPAAEADGIPPAPAQPDSRTYHLSPGDVVRIEVFGEPDLATTARITSAQAIAFPLIDTVEVAGRSIEELQSDIRRRLEDGFIRHAPVTVSVIEFGPRLVYVMGSVTNQNPVSLAPFTDTTAMQAIGKAGGTLPNANLSAAVVVRDDPKHPGQKLRLPISANVSDALAKDVVLEPGDMIVVPPLDRIYVTGRVRTSGALNLPGEEKLTVSKAISLAGGFDTYAKQTQVLLIRTGEPVRTIDVQALLSAGRGDDPILQPGDIVRVPER